ncbi:patatin-like phospholipase family protein [Pseudoalteromonas sp. SG43-5]|uniref:patatin-like phospholipase family protein n=1 Tax=Pseudoalteromonas sp. SG43-5 TaxID=2760968 RepID=UPI0016032C17|nr:patatin-like phospholipase family protein [Pseudoalteromonas sp. SG43-5]MBB1454602.1 patatin-like phospholipase family protein [Pseudoalteromonas sp. SG43-5]
MTKLGLVFSGGGGKGAYEIGVWKALNEFGIAKNVEAVAGTSVGGLNAALFTAGDYSSAEQLWLDIAPSKVLTLKAEDIAIAVSKFAVGAYLPGVAPKALMTLSFLLGGTGAFSQDGLAELIYQSNVCNSIDNNNLPLHLCALTAKNGELVYPQLNALSAEEKQKWLLATSAIPAVFKAVEIDGTNYVDGGVLPSYSDNTPYKPLIEQHNCTHIINIYLDRQADTVTAIKQYPRVNFWNIVPSQAFAGLIEPLNFTKENAANLIELGYSDTAKILKQFKPFMDDEARFMQAAFEFAASNTQFNDQISVNQQLRDDGALDSKQLISPHSLDDVLSELAHTLNEQELEIASQNVDSLIDKFADNSNELLEQAFNTITTLASTEGRINTQLEQGHVGRLLGSVTGSNAKLQAGINYDFNRAIYSSQLLIQKLNHKQALTMEAMVSLANKTNYLMTHVNVLYGSVKKLEQNVFQAVALMKQGIEALAHQCNVRCNQLENRIENLERSQLVNNWYNSTKSKCISLNTLQPSELLISVTLGFYNDLGREWSNSELSCYTNLLHDIGLHQTLLTPCSLFSPSSAELFSNNIQASAILPVAPKHQQFHPLLKGLQIASDAQNDATAKEINQTIEQQLGLSLNNELSGYELGLELLHSLKCNDKRLPAYSNTGNVSLLTANEHTTMQTQLLGQITTYNAVNNDILNNKNIRDDLAFLQKQIEQFKVIVPVIGQFSAGKSSLLNNYLGQDYLKCDINPETAVATELSYSEDEHIIINYIDSKQSERKALSELHNLKVDANIYYIQVFINIQKLKNRPNLVLVDMPGFASSNAGHSKAIACYLERGDYFINLIPSEKAFDATAINQLQEINFNYEKDIAHIVSKSERLPSSKLLAVKSQLQAYLAEALESDITIGNIENIGNNKNIIDFENVVDNALNQFDSLLCKRYSQQLAKLAEHITSSINGLKKSSQSSEAQLQEQINKSQNVFSSVEKKLHASLEDLEYNLCSVGKEQLIQRSQHVLSSSVSVLVSSAKSNQVSQKINDLLRPILQQGVDSLVQQELQKLDKKLDIISEQQHSDVQITLNIPAEQKETFSATYAAVAAGVATVILGPLGGIVSGIIGGLLGRKDNAEEREQLIESQVREQVIPQAVNMAVEYCTQQLNTAVMKIKQAILGSYEQEQNDFNQSIEHLKQQLQQSEDAFNELQLKYDNALVQIQIQQTKQPAQVINDAIKEAS